MGGFFSRKNDKPPAKAAEAEPQTQPEETKPNNNASTTKPKKNGSKQQAKGNNQTGGDPSAAEKPARKPRKKPRTKEPTGQNGGEAQPTRKPRKPKVAPAANASDGEDGGDFGDALVAAQTKKVGKEDFDLLTVIGKGSFGKVMQVRFKKDGKIYAMKVMRKDAIIAKNQVTHTKDEKNILQLIQHPFIVNLHFAFQTKDKLYMVLDYVNGGELFYHLKKEGKFSEERVRMYAAEIASALMHLHKNNIIYRDLKPENILLDRDGHIVITDFGLSKEVPKDDATHTFCGTPEYLAPEVLRGQGHSYPVDWWSLGTLVYEMLTGLPPYYSKHINVMYQKILNAQLTFPASMSDDARGLLEGLLTRDPAQRLGGDSVKKHPFFKGLDWDKLERREVVAPWKPPVRDEKDTTQIDDYFTAEKPSDSVVEGSVLDDLDEEDKDIFEGFTFAGKTVLAEASES